MPVEQRHEVVRAVRRGLGFTRCGREHFRGDPARPGRAGSLHGSRSTGTSLHGAQQIARSFRRHQRLFRQAHAEGLFDARQQFHARQAVETEIALQQAVETHRRHTGLAAQLGRQLPHEFEQQRVRPIGRVPARGFVHGYSLRARGRPGSAAS